jgi:protein arginine N-methyltransferase 5
MNFWEEKDNDLFSQEMRSDLHANTTKEEYEPCETLYFGYEVNTLDPMSIDKALNIIQEQEINYVINDMTLHEIHVEDGKIQLDDRPIYERYNIESVELLQRTTDWSNALVGRLDVYAFDALGSKDLSTVNTARNIIEMELDWAFHLNLPAVVLPCPTEANLVHYANILVKNLHLFCYFWVRVPVNQWHIWNELRLLCNSAHQVIPVVELKVFDESEGFRNNVNTLFWSRWFGEDLKAYILSLHAMENEQNASKPSFATTGPNSYIVDFIKRGFRHGLQIVFTGTPCGKFGDGLRAYIEAINHIYSTCDKLTEIEMFEKPYRDVLQAPLQPLHNNLESQTYEVFEKDPVKYALYQEAIRLALIDKSKHMDKVVVMVLGAGRGPLVKSTIKAANQAKVKVKIYAVEKNPNALPILLHFKKTVWAKMDIHIVHSDMRTWQPEEQADIIVSELLGSFGDNELSPECLDGAQRFLKPSSGISIPCSYRSYLRPLMSAKIYQEIKTISPANVEQSLETAYVVNVFNGVPLCEPKQCFSFEHPRLAKPNSNGQYDNKRYNVLDFICPECSPTSGSNGHNEMMIHALIGYFECTLYGNILLSILPSTMTEGMFSWFPIVFPLKTPLSVKSGAHIQVHMYRCADKTKIWYEWIVKDLTSHQITPIHNINGKSYSIAL